MNRICLSVIIASLGLMGSCSPSCNLNSKSGRSDGGLPVHYAPNALTEDTLKQALKDDAPMLRIYLDYIAQGKEETPYSFMSSAVKKTYLTEVRLQPFDQAAPGQSQEPRVFLGENYTLSLSPAVYASKLRGLLRLILEKRLLQSPRAKGSMRDAVWYLNLGLKPVGRPGEELIVKLDAPEENFRPIADYIYREFVQYALDNPSLVKPITHPSAQSPPTP